jgi:urease accessory protein
MNSCSISKPRLRLRGGDALVLEDGRLIEVVAAPEPLVEIKGSDPLHLGADRPGISATAIPTQIVARGCAFRRDHVIEAMVKGLGARFVGDRGAVSIPKAAPMRPRHEHSRPSAVTTPATSP